MFPPSDRGSSVLTPTSEYAPEERRVLLRLAHRSIESALDGHRLELDISNQHLSEKRGAFTTLHARGRLRGCIGYVMPKQSLFRTVAETARAAAFEDPRFTPVTEDEVGDLSVEISVLSLLRPIRPEDVIVGVHGLMVTMSGRRGLLLPQVPVEWHWDRTQYLSQVCIKAGLPPDAWAQRIDLQAFTAEVFGESTVDRGAKS